MKLPFMVLSYGNFEDHHKLLSCDFRGDHCLPVFTNPEFVKEYSDGMHQIMMESGDFRKLVPQVCEDSDSAYNLLLTVSTTSDDLAYVLIDPPSPIDKLGLAVKKDIDEVIHEFLDMRSESKH